MRERIAVLPGVEAAQLGSGNPSSAAGTPRQPCRGVWLPLGRREPEAAPRQPRSLPAAGPAQPAPRRPPGTIPAGLIARTPPGQQPPQPLSCHAPQPPAPGRTHGLRPAAGGTPGGAPPPASGRSGSTAAGAALLGGTRGRGRPARAEPSRAPPSSPLLPFSLPTCAAAARLCCRRGRGRAVLPGPPGPPRSVPVPLRGCSAGSVALLGGMQAGSRLHGPTAPQRSSLEHKPRSFGVFYMEW